MLLMYVHQCQFGYGISSMVDQYYIFRQKLTHLSGHFSQKQAKMEVVKIKKILIFPTGLEVHLEDMF